MLVLPKYAKNYASTIDKSRSNEPHMLNKNLTLFMKRLSPVRKNRARAKERLCLKGVRQEAKSATFVLHRLGGTPLQSVILIFLITTALSKRLCLL